MGSPPLLLGEGLGVGAGTFSGEATSPIIENLSFEEAIASWNAQAPSGTWIDILLRVRANHEWSQWFQMGVWTAGSDGSVQRHSVANQQDEMARIAVDTLIMQSGKAEGLQLRVRLYSESSDNSPVIENMAIALSDHPSANPTLSSGDPTRWGNSLSVPACSQMAYPDGGEIWCSPTSVSMVLRYWAQEAGQEIGDCEPWVRRAVDGVYDYVYDGHGNWPFNVAYASTQGMEGYITRLSGLDEAEKWIARGIPLIVSYGWNAGELDNAPFEWSTGHIAVLSGFDDVGNPIVHDPGGFPNKEVRRIYRRDQFERLWLSHSAGTTYVIMPTATATNTPTATATNTPINTPIATPTNTPTNTVTPIMTHTATVTPTMTHTATVTPIMTHTATITPIMTHTATVTPIMTHTATPIQTATAIPNQENFALYLPMIVR